MFPLHHTTIMAMSRERELELERLGLRRRQGAIRGPASLGRARLLSALAASSAIAGFFSRLHRARLVEQQLPSGI